MRSIKRINENNPKRVQKTKVLQKYLYKLCTRRCPEIVKKNSSTKIVAHSTYLECSEYAKLSLGYVILIIQNQNMI